MDTSIYLCMCLVCRHVDSGLHLRVLLGVFSVHVLPTSISWYTRDHVFPFLTIQNTRNDDSEKEADDKNKG